MRLQEILPIAEWLGSYSLKRLGPDVPSEGLDRKIDEFLAERKKPKN